MKDFKPMTAEKARDLLKNKYNWDVLKMATELCISIPRLTSILQCGNPDVTEHGLKTSYDVCFTPVVNVERVTKNPETPTKEEINEIIKDAIIKVKSDIDDKISARNIEFIRTYCPCGSGSKSRTYIYGNENTVDPEILFELTINTYRELYPGIVSEHAVAFGQIYEHARTLTEKYKNTDWSQEDFWDAMDTEAAAILIKKRKAK